MSETIIIKPLEWNNQLIAKDRELFDAVQQFFEREFGERRGNLGQYQRVYVSVRAGGEINGVAGVVTRADIPLFHVGSPTPGDRLAIRDALAATELLYNRLRCYIEDAGGIGYETFIYVAPEARERWAKFLERIGAKDANRFVVVP